MAKKLIPRNMRKSIKKTIISNGGTTAESKRKGKNEVRSNIREQVQTGEMQRKTVTWNFKIGDLVRIKNSKKHDNTLKLGIVLKNVMKTNYYCNKDINHITVMTSDNNSCEINPTSLRVLQRMS
jgi:hypothetical protein